MVLVTFTSDFSYSSISLADFQLDGFSLRVDKDIEPANLVLAGNETIADFSSFAQLQLDSGLSHRYQEDTTLAESFDLINGISFTRLYSSERVFVGWRDAGSDYVAYTISYDDFNGVVEDTNTMSTTVRPQSSGIPNFGVGYATLDMDTRKTTLMPFYSSGGGGTGSTITTMRVEPSGGNYRSQVDKGTAGIQRDAVVITLDDSYIAIVGGHNSGRISVVTRLRSESSSSNDNEQILFQNNIGGDQAVCASPMPVNPDNQRTRFLAFYNQQFHIYESDNDVVNGDFTIVSTATLSDYYVERVHYQESTDKVFFLGLSQPGLGSSVPATNYTSLDIFETDLTFSQVTQLGSIRCFKGCNRHTVELPLSTKLMFTGCSFDVALDGFSSQLINTEDFMTVSNPLLGTERLLSGAHRWGAGDPRVTMTVRRSNASDYYDFSGATYSIATVTSFG